MLKALDPLDSSSYVDAAASGDTTLSPEIIPSSGLQETFTVLVVDDDPDSLYLLEHILAQYACRVVCQSDGRAALDIALQLQPDLILLDIWLPSLSGLDILKQLRQHARGRSIPVVAVTALASERDRHLIMQAGCNHYISKPYELEDMEQTLSQFLSLRPS